MRPDLAIGLPCRVIVWSGETYCVQGERQTELPIGASICSAVESKCARIKRLRLCLNKAIVLGMSRYSAEVEKHFLNPCNARALEAPDGVGNGFNEACGDELRIFVRLCDNDRVEEMTFQARACSAVIAAASVTTQALQGERITRAAAFDVEAAMNAIGGLPRQRAHAPRVVQRALAEALQAAQS